MPGTPWVPEVAAHGRACRYAPRPPLDPDRAALPRVLVHQRPQLARPSPLSCEGLLEGLVRQKLLGHQPLEARVLRLQLLEPLHLRALQRAVQAPPPVVALPEYSTRCEGEPVFGEQVPGVHAAVYGVATRPCYGECRVLAGCDGRGIPLTRGHRPRRAGHHSRQDSRDGSWQSRDLSSDHGFGASGRIDAAACAARSTLSREE
jgi:hypothetical protein